MTSSVNSPASVNERLTGNGLSRLLPFSLGMKVRSLHADTMKAFRNNVKSPLAFMSVEGSDVTKLVRTHLYY